MKTTIFIARLLVRIIAIPFWSGLSLLYMIALFLKLNWNFLRFGGEAITYTKKMQRKTIQDVFEILINQTKP